MCAEPLTRARTRSYGSLSGSGQTHTHRYRQHRLQPGDTLQGLALMYGVSMEDIKRANRLYTNDSIFLKESLSIPVPARLGTFSGDASVEEESQASNRSLPLENGERDGKGERRGSDVEEKPDLSPMDFLKRMDGLISQSKQAAVKKIQEGGKSLSCMEPEVPPHSPSPQQRTILGAAPLTVDKRTRALRDAEDEMFEL